MRDDLGEYVVWDSLDLRQLCILFSSSRPYERIHHPVASTCLILYALARTPSTVYVIYEYRRGISIDRAKMLFDSSFQWQFRVAGYYR